MKSTNKKDLKQCFTEPTLAQWYKTAAREVYGRRANVSRKRWDQFMEAEIRLRKAGVDPRHYAMTVAKLWRNWCKRKNMVCIPINVFLGKKSYEMYKTFTKEKPTIELSRTVSEKANATVINDEITIASIYIRMYIEGAKLPINDILAAVDVSDEWILAKKEGRRPIKQALEVLNSMHHTDAMSYEGVAESVIARK